MKLIANNFFFFISDKCFRQKGKTITSHRSKGKKYENEVIKNSDMSHRSVEDHSPPSLHGVRYTSSIHSSNSARRRVDSSVHNKIPSASVDNPSISFVEELDYDNIQSNQRRHLADELVDSSSSWSFTYCHVSVKLFVIFGTLCTVLLTVIANTETLVYL